MKYSMLKLDVFRKMPKDLTEPTFCGAVVSMLCTGLLIILCGTEFQKYMTIETRSNMFVDSSHHDDRLNINVDIVFPKMPCEVLSLDIMDIMGTHIIDIAGSLYKRRISENGEFISQSSMLDYIQNRADLLRKIKEELDQKQGCQLKGNFNINRVPGNFHISTHAHNDLIVSLEMQGYTFDFSHKINHVSFGREEDFKTIQETFKKQHSGVLNPIDGKEFRANFDTKNKPVFLVTNFFLAAVSSYYMDTSHQTYNMYQLTSTYKSESNANVSDNMLMFSYELSPIKVLFQQEEETIVDFCTRICAIIGGIFTIASVVDALIHRSVSLLFKERIGKLS